MTNSFTVGDLVVPATGQHALHILRWEEAYPGGFLGPPPWWVTEVKPKHIRVKRLDGGESEQFYSQRFVPYGTKIDLATFL